MFNLDLPLVVLDEGLTFFDYKEMGSIVLDLLLHHSNGHQGIQIHYHLSEATIPRHF